MKNGERLGGIFAENARFHVPVWQRTYVWEKDKQWEPLWEHIEKLANKQLKEGKEGSVGVPHFLGVLVHKQLSTPTGKGEARQIVDGQQRLTTLQIVIAALIDLHKEKGSEDYKKKESKNCERTFEDLAKKQLKVWHNNADRKYFRDTMKEGSYKKIKEKSKDDKHLIPKCYQYFYLKLKGWLGKAKDDDLKKRLGCLRDAISKGLILVVIDLDKGEDANLIFETLNFLGAQLSPIDRVRNFLFQQVDDQKQKALYNLWKPLDGGWWLEKEGKVSGRPIDRFLVQYVMLFSQQYLGQTPPGEDLFRAFKECHKQGLEDQREELASQHLKRLCSHAQSFYDLHHRLRDDPVTVFLERSRIANTHAPLPIVLKMFHETKDGSEGQKDDFHKALKDMESFLVRSVFCRRVEPNYFRKIFPEMIAKFWSEGFSSTKIREFLKSQEWPSDEKFREAFCNRKAQAKSMVLLAIAEAMEEDEDSDKSEGKVTLKGELNIEHIMPVKWRKNWPLPETEPPSKEYVKGRLEEMMGKLDGTQKKDVEQLAEDLSELSDQLAPKDALEKRKEAIQQFGNLTLLAPPLNSGLGNSRWSAKKKKLSKHGRIAMNRDLLKYEDWNEETIRQRGEELFEYALMIWPHPDTPPQKR